MRLRQRATTHLASANRGPETLTRQPTQASCGTKYTVCGCDTRKRRAVEPPTRGTNPLSVNVWCKPSSHRTESRSTTAATAVVSCWHLSVETQSSSDKQQTSGLWQQIANMTTTMTPLFYSQTNYFKHNSPSVQPSLRHALQSSQLARAAIVSKHRRDDLLVMLPSHTAKGDPKPGGRHAPTPDRVHASFSQPPDLRPD